MNKPFYLFGLRTMVGFAISLVTLLWDGFVLTRLWLWFVVPVFALPVLTVSFAMGLCLLFRFITGEGTFTNPPEDESSYFKQVAVRTILWAHRTWFMLIVGLAVKAFVM